MKKILSTLLLILPLAGALATNPPTTSVNSSNTASVTTAGNNQREKSLGQSTGRFDITWLIEHPHWLAFGGSVGVLGILVLASQWRQFRSSRRIDGRLDTLKTTLDEQGRKLDQIGELNEKLGSVLAEVRNFSTHQILELGAARLNSTVTDQDMRVPASVGANLAATVALGNQEKALLKALVSAIDAHGKETSSGQHKEIEISEITPYLPAPRNARTLKEALAKLNLIAPDSPHKPLREQNFLSIVSVRSRELVRVQKDAMAGLEELVA